MASIRFNILVTERRKLHEIAAGEKQVAIIRKAPYSCKPSELVYSTSGASFAECHPYKGLCHAIYTRTKGNGESETLFVLECKEEIEQKIRESQVPEVVFLTCRVGEEHWFPRTFDARLIRRVDQLAAAKRVACRETLLTMNNDEQYFASAQKDAIVMELNRTFRTYGVNNGPIWVAGKV